MTQDFLLKYIPRFMRDIGYQEGEYFMDWVEIPIPANSKLVHRGGTSFYFFPLENAYNSPEVTVESPNGLCNFVHADEQNAYIHEGNIILTNSHPTDTKKTMWFVAYPARD
ncbi:MAG: hypothetical protein H6581_20630 [Bacteroidia bacterium]|nr:hypothetical protein [Bacteroidia bacterium]